MEDIHIVNTGSWADDFGFKSVKDAAAFYELALKAERLQSHYIENKPYFSNGEKRQVVIKSGVLCSDKEIEAFKEAELAKEAAKEAELDKKIEQAKEE